MIDWYPIQQNISENDGSFKSLVFQWDLLFRGKIWLRFQGGRCFSHTAKQKQSDAVWKCLGNNQSQKGEKTTRQQFLSDKQTCIVKRHAKEWFGSKSRSQGYREQSQNPSPNPSNHSHSNFPLNPPQTIHNSMAQHIPWYISNGGWRSISLFWELTRVFAVTNLRGCRL